MSLDSRGAVASSLHLGDGDDDHRPLRYGLPVNTQLGAYYNVVHPDDGANWQLRLQVQFMFPK